MKNNSKISQIIFEIPSSIESYNVKFLLNVIIHALNNGDPICFEKNAIFWLLRI